MDKKKVSLAVGILSANLLVMSTSAVGAAIAAIAKSFPKEPISKVQMLSTIPQLGQVVATLLFAWLTYHMTRKNVGLLAILFAGVGGIIPAIWNSSLNMILGCMILLGFGIGIISNVGPVLVQEHFDGEERATVMGWQIGFNNVGMMVLTAVGGALGASNWRNLFWIFAVAFVILIFFYIMVPQDQRAKEVKSDGKQSFWASFKGLSGYVWIILLITFLMSIIMTAFMANQSIVLASKGHGTGYTAIVTAIGNIGGIITALCLGYIRKLTKRDTMAWGFVAFCLSFICILFSNNVVMHVIGNMFSGVGIVMVNATIPFMLSILADKSRFPVVISMNTLVSSIAGAVTPIILAALSIGAGVAQYYLGAILSVALAALLLVLRIGTKIEKASQQV